MALGAQSMLQTHAHFLQKDSMYSYVALLACRFEDCLISDALNPCHLYASLGPCGGMLSCFLPAPVRLVRATNTQSSERTQVVLVSAGLRLSNLFYLALKF